MADAFEFVRIELTKIEFKPGDKFVLKVDRPISHTQMERIAAMWVKHMPGNELIFLDMSMTLTKLESIEEPTI